MQNAHMSQKPDEDRAIDEVVSRLSEKFPSLSPEHGYEVAHATVVEPVEFLVDDRADVLGAQRRELLGES